MAADSTQRTDTLPDADPRPPDTRSSSWGLRRVLEFLIKAKQREQALEVLDMLIAEDPSVEEDHYQRTMLAIELGRLAEAEAHLRPLLEASPPVPSAHRFLARVLERQGRFAEALDVAREGKRRAPSDGRYDAILAELQGKARRLEPRPIISTRNGSRTKVLFYGGCHAGVLRNIFTAHGTRTDIDCEVITNFGLIASGAPFPLERLGEYGLVVFSPILHRAGYNTDALRARCDEVGVRTLSYPWVEWHGYFPGAVKDAHFFGCEQWNCRYVTEAALICDSFAAFRTACVEGTGPLAPFAAQLAPEFDLTPQRLKSAEQVGEVDIRVSGFIEATYRRHRLFQTPDHPTLRLYEYLARRISELCEFPLAPDAFRARQEPQREAVMPILPFVARALGLAFDGSGFVSKAAIGSHEPVTFESYLELCYMAARRHTLFVAQKSTTATAFGGAGDNAGTAAQTVTVPAGERFVGAVMDDDGTQVTVRIERQAARVRLPLDVWMIRKRDWTIMSEVGKA